MNVFSSIIYAIVMIFVLMAFCGYAVLLERKVASWVQGRVGPNRTGLPFVDFIPVVGPLLKRLGLWQPLADGLKFLFKEEPIPGHVKKGYFFLGPLLALVPALVTMVVVPFGQYWNAQGEVCPLILANVDIGILFIFAISALGVYGIVLGGWAANSKYPLFGCIRSSAQMISYELALGFSVVPVFLWVSAPGVNSGLSLVSIVGSQKEIWTLFWQPLSALIFLVALFAETNRLPFDMPESETELVGGFHTEYGAFRFGAFFLAEYAHMIVGSALFVLLFLGGWYFLPGMPWPWPHNGFGSLLGVIWFLIKVALLLFFFMWIRWTLPRFRYDQVMKLGWTGLLPLALLNLLIYLLLIAFIEGFYG